MDKQFLEELIEEALDGYHLHRSYVLDYICAEDKAEARTTSMMYKQVARWASSKLQQLEDKS